MAFQLRAIHIHLLTSVVIALAAFYYVFPTISTELVGGNSSNVNPYNISLNSTNNTNDISAKITSTDHSSASTDDTLASTTDDYDPTTDNSDPVYEGDFQAFGENNGTSSSTRDDGWVVIGESLVVIHREWLGDELVKEVEFHGDDAAEQRDAYVKKRELEKRARNAWNVQPFPNDQLCNYIMKGRDWFMSLMFLDINGADQMMTNELGADPVGTQWQREDQTKAGFFIALRYWTSRQYQTEATFTGRLAPIKNALASLYVGNQPVYQVGNPLAYRRRINMNVHPNGPNVPVRWWQDKGLPKGISGPERLTEYYTPTGAVYANIYNPIDGVIINQGSFGPEHMMAQNPVPDEDPLGRIPKIKTWSDLTWVLWARFHPNNPSGTSARYGNDYWYNAIPGYRAPSNNDLSDNKGWLNFIVVQAVVGPPQTQQIIASCLWSRGYKDFRDGNVPQWANRQTFLIGSWCYYALLATPTNYGIAWFLIQHKVTLGLKVPVSVTIWWGEDVYSNVADAVYTSHPNLIWAIEDATVQLIHHRDGIEQAWINLPGNSDYKELNIPANPL